MVRIVGETFSLKSKEDGIQEENGLSDETYREDNKMRVS